MGLDEVYESLKATRQRLVDELDENEKQYWQNMRSWFKRLMTKEEFDTECRRLLPPEKTHLHNEFIFAVITKCQLQSHPSTSKDQTSAKAKKNKQKMQKIKRKFDQRFVTISSQSLNNEQKPPIVKKSTHDRGQMASLCSKTLEIPSHGDMNARVGIVAWENGLDDFELEITSYLLQALKTFLKKLLIKLCERRSSYSVTNFIKHSYGTEPVNPYLSRRISSLGNDSEQFAINRITYEDAEQKAIEKIGSFSTNLQPSKAIIAPYDLMQLLKVYRNSIIPDQNLLSLAMERTMAIMNHVDTTQIQQDQIYKKIHARPTHLVMS